MSFYESFKEKLDEAVRFYDDRLSGTIDACEIENTEPWRKLEMQYLGWDEDFISPTADSFDYVFSFLPGKLSSETREKFVRNCIQRAHLDFILTNGDPLKTSATAIQFWLFYREHLGLNRKLSPEQTSTLNKNIQNAGSILKAFPTKLDPVRKSLSVIIKTAIHNVKNKEHGWQKQLAGNLTNPDFFEKAQLDVSAEHRFFISKSDFTDDSIALRVTLESDLIQYKLSSLTQMVNKLSK